MKNIKQIKIGNETHDLYFTIGDLRRIERETGRSLVSTVLGNMQVIRATIDFLVATLKYGLHDKLRTDEDVYDLIDAYCADGEHTIDMLGGELLTAIYATNFFIPGKAMEQLKPASKKSSKA